MSKDQSLPAAAASPQPCEDIFPESEQRSMAAKIRDVVDVASVIIDEAALLSIARDSHNDAINRESMGFLAPLHDPVTCWWCVDEQFRLLAHAGELGRTDCPIEKRDGMAGDYSAIVPAYVDLGCTPPPLENIYPPELREHVGAMRQDNHDPSTCWWCQRGLKLVDCKQEGSHV